MRDRNDRPQDETGIDAWLPWHPDEAMNQLAGLSALWCVAGGWALDLWLGRQTRPHHDLEIAVLRQDFATFRARLSGFRCFVAADGEVSVLPSQSSPGLVQHQIWILDYPAKAWRMDILLEPGDERTWVFRRNEAVRRSRSEMIAVTAGGIPYLKPEGVLLYKATAPRSKDEKDFASCAPLMEPAARAWLRDALACLYPSHRWIDDLG
jgi:Aminoglycoside-2''-adenylyltransferase